MMILVVTGGIGSGKSLLCRMLRDKGWTVQYNADDRVKALYSECPGLLESLERTLGCTLRDSGGRFLPRLLAQRIFVDKDALNQVEGLVFPALTKDFEDFCQTHRDAPVIIFESATILEKPQFDGFGDKVVLVDAPLDMRLERACSRDGADPAAVKARMANQPLMNRISGGERDPRVDFLIKNDSTTEELEKKIEELMLNIHN